MIQTYDHGGVIEHARAYVARNFAPRQQGSRILAVVLLTICALSVASTAAHMDPASAIFGVGLASGVAGHVMLVGWGASSGHGDVCICTAEQIDKRARVIDARLDDLIQTLEKNAYRLDDIEEIVRVIAGELRGGMGDELRLRRGRN